MTKVVGEQSDESVELANAINTLTDVFVKGDAVNPSVRDLLKELNGNFKTNNKNQEKEKTSTKAKDMEDVMLGLQNIDLQKRKLEFKDKGENDEKTSSEEKLKGIEQGTLDRLKQVEGFIGNTFIPRTLQNLLSFFGGKEFLQGINSAITGTTQKIFAGKELRESTEIKHLEKKIAKESLDRKQRELEEQDMVSGKSELRAEGDLSNITTKEEETSANGSKMVEKKNAVESESEELTGIEIVKINSEAADAIANAIKKVLSENREIINNNNNKDTPADSNNIQKGVEPVVESVDKLADKVSSFGDIEGEIGGGETKKNNSKNNSESRKSSAEPSLFTQLGEEAARDVTTVSLLKLITKRVAAAEAVAIPAAVATEVATGGAGTPVAAAEVGVAAPVVGVTQALIEYFTDSQNRHAKGGPIKNPNKPVLVGEEGPEIFVPENTGFIIPNNNITNKEKGLADSPAVEKMTSLLTQVISLPSEKLAAISNTTNISDNSKDMLQAVNKTLLDISDKLDNKNSNNNSQDPSKFTGLMNSSNNSSNSTINIISQSNPITNSRLKMDNFLYNRRAYA